VPYEAEVDKNKETGQLLLKNLEDTAKRNMEGLLKEVRGATGTVATEDLKKRYYQARAVYHEVAAQTGAESPSKVAEAVAVKQAVVNKKKTDIAASIGRAATMADFTDSL